MFVIWERVKAFPNDNLSVAYMLKYPFDRIIHKVKKKKILVTNIFSFFPQSFQKAASFHRVSKVCWLYEKAANGLEQILHGALIKETPGKCG